VNATIWIPDKNGAKSEVDGSLWACRRPPQGRCAAWPSGLAWPRRRRSTASPLECSRWLRRRRARHPGRRAGAGTGGNVIGIAAAGSARARAATCTGWPPEASEREPAATSPGSAWVASASARVGARGHLPRRSRRGAGGGLDGIAVGLVGVGSGGLLRGIAIGGLGVGAGDGARGIVVAGLRWGRGGTSRARGGGSRGAGGAIQGVAIAGLGVGAARIQGLAMALAAGGQEIQAR